MTTDIDWGTVLLDTVKELAAQPGGEPWTAVANGLVKLLEENATLKAEVERLRRLLDLEIRLKLQVIQDRERCREALRRVVEAVEASNRPDWMHKELKEALAFAKGVMEG